MEELNKVEVIGIVGKCLTLTTHDKQHTRFELASSRLDIDEEGKRAIEITWLLCSTFNAPEGLRNGAKVKVTGRLRSKTVDKSGETHYITEILAQSVELL